jgi:hypothetical protein
MKTREAASREPRLLGVQSKYFPPCDTIRQGPHSCMELTHEGCSLIASAISTLDVLIMPIKRYFFLSWKRVSFVITSIFAKRFVYMLRVGVAKPCKMR